MVETIATDGVGISALHDAVAKARVPQFPVRFPPALAEAIKVLARAHQNLIWARTRHTNGLRSALREYYPAALAAFEDLADAFPEPTSCKLPRFLARLRPIVAQAKARMVEE